MGDGSLLLGVGLGREDDVGVPASRRPRTSRPRARTSPCRAPRSSRARREVADGVGVDQERGVEAPVGEAVADPGRVAPRRRLGRARARRPGCSPTSRRPRPLAPSGTSSRPAPSSSRVPGAVDQRAASGSPAHTITVEPGFSTPAIRSASAPSSPGAALVSLGAELGRQRREETRLRTRARSGRSPRRRRRGRVGRSVATASAGAVVGAPPCGSAGRGSASRAAGRVPTTRIASARVEVGDAGAQLRPRELDAARPSRSGPGRPVGASDPLRRARLDVRRAERPADDPLGQIALLVRGGAADDRRRPLARARAGPAAAASSASSQLAGRSSPPPADQRLGDPLARTRPSGSRSGPCRTASRRRPRGCRGPAPAGSARRGR